MARSDIDRNKLLRQPQAGLRLLRRRLLCGCLLGGVLPGARQAGAQALLPATGPGPIQPYFAALLRVVEALRIVGSPLAAADESSLRALAADGDEAAVAAAEALLAPHVLLNTTLDKDGAGQTTAGSAPAELVEQGWRSFLVRVVNPYGVQAPLDLPRHLVWRLAAIESVQPEGRLAKRSSLAIDPFPMSAAADLERRWMGFRFYTGRPLEPALAGLQVEYRVLELWSRDRGERSAQLALATTTAPRESSYYKGERRGVEMRFTCLPTQDVALQVRDFDGTGCMASLVVRDAADRLYPAPAHRLAPDFDFQPQVYRADGESLRLPPGSFTVTATRGPEYLPQTQLLQIAAGAHAEPLRVDLRRWFNASALGWYPGDTHIHAAGCSHYEDPTSGVGPQTMIRHVRGEALAVGDVLTWGPGYYQQRRYFSGRVYQPTNTLEHEHLQHAVNASLRPQGTPRDGQSLIRYDLEISGFPSSESGHLVLLGLTDQNYPGARRLEEWPSWNLPILRWAQRQGAVVGFAHCASGMMTASLELPNHELPAFDGIGANETFVALAHGAVDFVSGAERLPVAELNFWYHALNCGFSTPMVGETDFPCLSDERVGRGRTYVGLERPPAGDPGFRRWVLGIRSGRLYFGDGRSHFIDLACNGVGVGRGAVALTAAGTVRVQARVAAHLEPAPQGRSELPDWHLERARLGTSREVTLELIRNGRAVASQRVLADGQLRAVAFDVEVGASAWLALRILPSGHTAPLYVRVAGAPLRASRRSAQWLHDCVDVLWAEKGPRIRAAERPAAAAAYAKAREVYRQRIAASEPDS